MTRSQKRREEGRREREGGGRKEIFTNACWALELE